MHQPLPNPYIAPARREHLNVSQRCPLLSFHARMHAPTPCSSPGGPGRAETPGPLSATEQRPGRQALHTMSGYAESTASHLPQRVLRQLRQLGLRGTSRPTTDGEVHTRPCRPILSHPTPILALSLTRARPAVDAVVPSRPFRTHGPTTNGEVHSSSSPQPQGPPPHGRERVPHRTSWATNHDMTHLPPTVAPTSTAGPLSHAFPPCIPCRLYLHPLRP